MTKPTAERMRQLEERLRTLWETSKAFAEATTDYERLLDAVARGLAEVVKDGCVVRLLSDDGWLRPVAIQLPLETQIEDRAALADLRRHVSAAHHVSEQATAGRVIESGEPLLVPRIDWSQLSTTTAPAIVQAYQAIGVHSLLFVALRARAKSIGLLALVRFRPESPAFGNEDVHLAQALADNAALAISNARLFQATMEQLEEKERAELALRKTEEQLRHSQKMEAVGRLAGSVAHDFNNLLSVILSCSDMVLSDMRQMDPSRTDVESIKKAGERASVLTRQLLAFGRQQVLSPRIVDLNSLVRDSENLLRRVLGEDVELVLRLDRHISCVQADPHQLDQVIMNLAINSRDAMPSGGKLTVETMDVVLDDSYKSEHFGAAAGPHVMLAISDTGIGMDKETQSRIFEPFFTTKEIGKGTGLGLSTVFGIVKQSGGNVWVYSEPGEGATFKIYLPKAEQEADAPRVEPPMPRILTGNETILLVEDQAEVRQVASQVLRRYGYHVIEASNAGEALLCCERHPRTIHLLLTDVVMPMMSGRELAERLCEVRPQMKVLFMSGYTQNAIVHHGILDSGIEYLQKPLVPEALARRIREVLETPARS